MGRCWVFSGPAQYGVNEGQLGLAYSLTRRPPAEKPNTNPSAAHYNIKTTLGANGIRKSFGIHHADLRRNENPPPNLYTQPKQFSDETAFKFTFRPFEYELGLKVPAANTYKPNLSDLPSAPEYSFQDKLKPCFPDILGYPDQAHETSEPGPARYDDKTKTVEKSDGPKYSMGITTKKRRSANPGPNHYQIRTPCRPDAHKAPSFSFGRRTEQKHEKTGPGPAAYNLQEGLAECGWTMTGRTADPHECAALAIGELDMCVCVRAHYDFG